MSVEVSFNTDPEVTTTDATELDAFVVPIEPGNTCAVHLCVMARGYDNAASAMWEIIGQIKSLEGNLSAVPAGIVNVFTPRKDVGATTWDVNFAIVDHNVVVRVTGAALQSVGWRIVGDIIGFNNVNFGGIA